MTHEPNVLYTYLLVLVSEQTNLLLVNPKIFMEVEDGQQQA